MKRLFFPFALAAIILSAFFFSSCEIGMGESVDLEAPNVSITWPANNGYVPKSFDLKGIASDNRELYDIEVHYSYRETPEGEKINSILHTNTKNKKDGEWICHMEFNFDQEVSITVYARDKMGNESIESSDSIVVVIDSQEPENGAMIITRNSGFTTSTAKIGKFLGENGRTETRNKDSANKDNFQNESFTLSCNVEETYEIDKVYLNLYKIDASSNAYNKTVIKEEIVNENIKNPYNPEFTITEDALVSYNASLATGLHYIMPEVVVIDKAGNKSKPLSSDDPMVFAWEVEYDTPKAVLNLYYEESIGLKFQEGTTVPVVIFDDDGLKSYSYTLKSNDSGKVKTGSSDISDKNVRDHSFEIKTDKFDDNTKIPDGNYTLSITVEDQLSSSMSMGGVLDNLKY